MPLLLGILTTIAVISTIFTFHVAADILPQSFTIFLLIPIGALIAGMSCGSGVFIGIFFARKPVRYTHFVLASVLALIGFVGSYYPLYISTYVTPDMKINHSFKGQHISEFMEKTKGTPLTFTDYLRQEVGGRRSSFALAVRGRVVTPPMGSIELGSTYNWIKFALEGIGFLAGGALAGLFFVNRVVKERFKQGFRTSESAGVFVFLYCGKCSQKMRVPKGKGKIIVRCPSCSFQQQMSA